MGMTERIIGARKEKGINQKDMASKLKVSVASLNRYERGIRKPEIDVVTNIAKITGKSVDWILTGVNNNDQLQSEEIEMLKDEIVELQRKCISLMEENSSLKEDRQQLREKISSLGSKPPVRKKKTA
jgi:transcriptional regulator with XRE-family HTH domain